MSPPNWWSRLCAVSSAPSPITLFDGSPRLSKRLVLYLISLLLLVAVAVGWITHF